jgi:hypothetical protein
LSPNYWGNQPDSLEFSIKLDVSYLITVAQKDVVKLPKWYQSASYARYISPPAMTLFRQGGADIHDYRMPEATGKHGGYSVAFQLKPKGTGAENSVYLVPAVDKAIRILALLKSEGREMTIAKIA